MVERSPVHAPLPIARLATAESCPPLVPPRFYEPFPRSVASRNDRLTLDTGLTMRRAPCHCWEPRERAGVTIVGASRRLRAPPVSLARFLSLPLALSRSLLPTDNTSLFVTNGAFCSTSRRIQFSASNLIGRSLVDLAPFKGICRPQICVMR